jgi:hypothetical protein
MSVQPKSTTTTSATVPTIKSIAVDQVERVSNLVSSMPAQSKSTTTTAAASVPVLKSIVGNQGTRTESAELPVEPQSRIVESRVTSVIEHTSTSANSVVPLVRPRVGDKRSFVDADLSTEADSQPDVPSQQPSEMSMDVESVSQATHDTGSLIDSAQVASASTASDCACQHDDVDLLDDTDTQPVEQPRPLTDRDVRVPQRVLERAERQKAPTMHIKWGTLLHPIHLYQCNPSQYDVLVPFRYGGIRGCTPRCPSSETRYSPGLCQQ